MITKNRRKAGLVIVIVGLLVLAGSYIVGSGNSLTRDLIELVPSFLVSGITIVIVGLITMIAPRDPMEKRLEKVDQLEKRVAQLERERKNTP